MLLPTLQDLTYVRRTGIWSYGSLVEELDQAKVNYLYYVLNGDNSGHHCFTASGQEFNQLVAASNSGRATPNCRN